MPFGCSVWPSFWLVGPNWPNNGEIDVVEGVNNKQMNQYTFHTGANQNCSIPKQAPKVDGGSTFTGTVLNTICMSSPSSNTGCAFLDTCKSSFGQGFANAGGGAFALLWDNDGFKIWHFERQSIPHDVYSGNPNPVSWPPPKAFLSADNCDVDSFFSPQRLILDITLCGGWASSDYPNSAGYRGGRVATTHYDQAFISQTLVAPALALGKSLQGATTSMPHGLSIP